MKIIIATPLYPPEIETLASYVKELATRLKKYHEITIVAYASTAEQIPGVKLITVSKHLPLLIRLFMYTFVLLKASKHADIIYAQNSATSGFASIIVQKLRKIPVVINFAEHEAWKRAIQLQATTEPLESFVRTKCNNRRISSIMRLQKWTINRANNIIFSSTELAQTISKNYNIPDSKIIINFNAPKKPQILPFEIHHMPYQIFTNGHLFRWNNIADILDAISTLKQKFPDIKLLISGEGPEKENLKMLTERLSISNNIIFLGRISEAEEWYLLKASQIYIHNYNFIHENFPSIITSCFSAETPIISSNINNIQEIIFNNNGVLVKSNSAQELSGSITKIFNDDNFKHELINNAKKSLIEKFSWDIHIETLNNLFEKIYVDRTK
ncbi:MAG: glycosyltransferase family 4 protein [Patescibacteria group bacterium]